MSDEAASRFAIYWLPAVDDPLLALGQAWLGRDVETDRALPPPEAPAGVDWAATTAEPRRYGLHATLKAPFRLAAGVTRDHLATALTNWAAKRGAFTLDGLEVARVGRFIAITPAREAPDLDRLAADAVMDFDHFRAPLDDRDIARRRAQGLDERGALLLSRWGYPHVLERFRFHVTLTGPLDEPAAGLLLPWLASRFAAALARPVAISGVALFEEPAPAGQFRLVGRFPFKADPLASGGR